MSAIIAGDRCRGCGKKYWISLGGTEWWKRTAIKGLPPNDTYKIYDDFRHCGYCPGCYIIKLTEEDKTSSMSLEQLNFMEFMLESIDSSSIEEEQPIKRIRSS